MIHGVYICEYSDHHGITINIIFLYTQQFVAEATNALSIYC